MSTRVDHLYNPQTFPNSLQTGHVLRQRSSGDLYMIHLADGGRKVGLVGLTIGGTASCSPFVGVTSLSDISEAEAGVLLGGYLSNWDFIGSIDECLKESL